MNLIKIIKFKAEENLVKKFESSLRQKIRIEGNNLLVRDWSFFRPADLRKAKINTDKITSEASASASKVCQYDFSK